MFRIEEISDAHHKVKSGADFPAYIQDLKKLGVAHYDTFVADGHTDYFGADGYKASTATKYEALIIAAHSAVEPFKAALKAHQQGHTDYPAFCSDCAKSGIYKWTVSMDAMTCTYYDVAGNEMLTEQIPQ